MPAPTPVRVGFKPSGALTPDVTLLPTPTPSATAAGVSDAASPDIGFGLAGTLAVVVLAALLLRRVA